MKKFKYFVYTNFKNISSSLSSKTGKRNKTKLDSSVEVLKVQRKPRARSTSKKRQVKRKRGGGLHNKDLICLTSSSASDDNLSPESSRDLNKVTEPQKSYMKNAGMRT